MSILLQDTQLERLLCGSRIAKGATTGDASNRFNTEAAKCLRDIKKIAPALPAPLPEYRRTRVP